MSERRERTDPDRDSSAAEANARIADPIVALDEEGRCTYLNERAEQLFARTGEPLQGRVFWEEIGGEMGTTMREQHERAMAAQDDVAFEEYYPSADRWFSVCGYPSETGVSVTFREIADPDGRPGELEQREQTLRRAYEIIADPDRPFIEQVDDLLEVVRKAVGTDFATFSHVSGDTYVFEAVDVPEDVDIQSGDAVPLAELPNCKRAVESERTLVLGDVEAEAPELADPTWGIGCYLGTPVFAADDVYGTFCFYGMEGRAEEFSDWEVTFVELLGNWVTAELGRRAHNRELEAANERLEQFAYAVSHDLQEPLRMVTSYLELIERRYDDELDEDGREFIEFAVDGATRMSTMIDSLLEYSRIETKGNPFVPVDLDETLEHVLSDLSLQIEETDAEITSDDLPRVSGDPEQLRQLLQNLLENALNYSGDDPPRVDVSAERDGQEWVVAVSDQGVGIEPEDQERIFGVFQHLQETSDHEGSGIGLALCERIVERHDGEIDVESSPGKGATFSFSLPSAETETG